MTEFKIGDIVRVSKGEPDKPGYQCRVREVSDEAKDEWIIHPGILCDYEESGWTIELIERPAPPLPTKPNSLGWATVNGTRYLARLAYKQWELYNTDGVLGATPHPSAIKDFEEAVLIPKELADEFIDWNNNPYRQGAAVGALVEKLADHLEGERDE